MLQDGRLFVRAAQTLEATCAGTDGGTAAGGGETRIESDLIGTLYPSCRKIFARSTFRSVHASTIRISTLNRPEIREGWAVSKAATLVHAHDRESKSRTSRVPARPHPKIVTRRGCGVWGVGSANQSERASCASLPPTRKELHHRAYCSIAARNFGDHDRRRDALCPRPAVQHVLAGQSCLYLHSGCRAPMNMCTYDY